MHKTTAYLYFGYKPLRCQLDLFCLVSCGDLLVADIVIPMLMAHIDMLTTVLGMSLNLLKDVIIFTLRGISSLGMFFLLVGFGLLLLLARPGIIIP
jgi:hypothetical protein